MPKDPEAAPAETIETLRKWVLAGAPRERVISSGVVGELDTQPRIPPPPRRKAASRRT